MYYVFVHIVVSLFQQTQHQCNPVVMEYVTLPCLNILKNIISPSVKPSSKAHEVNYSSYSNHVYSKSEEVFEVSQPFIRNI